MTDRRQRMRVGWQLADLLRLAIVWAVALVVLAGAGLQRSAPVSELFLDPAAVAGVPWYTGLMSSAGVLGWTVAASAAAGGAWLAARLGRRSAAVFLGSGAALTAILLLDDLLQLHSAVLLAFGLAKPVAQLLVIAPAPAWVLAQRHEIGRTRWLVLVAAATGFAVSLFADQWLAPTAADAGGTMVEDGAKFLGICAWAQYFVMTTADIARSVISDVAGPVAENRRRERLPEQPSMAPERV